MNFRKIYFEADLLVAITFESGGTIADNEWEPTVRFS